jgi:DNA-binding CsgD family transcriptional regulator
MVDIDLLSSDIICLERVTRQGTAANRAKAYHSLAQIYLENGQEKDAEIMLDSLQTILNHNDSPIHVLHIDYKPILDHYLKKDNHIKVRQYVELMIHEQQAFKERGINYNLVEAIVELQTGNKLQELKIVKLRHTNQILWLLVCVIISLIIIAVVVTLLIYQNRRHKIQMRDADDRHAYLLQKLNQSNLEKEKIAQEVNEFLKDKDNRQELETLTPHVLKESGETKFRQCFELLYPLFLHRLREKVPSVTRREELLSMLIALHQDNKEIADLLAIAPRSVLMLRHRFRQKIGMNTDVSLENFIEDLLRI